MTLADKRRAAQAARKRRGGNPKPVGNPAGRPRKPDRCPCGANTLKRATARGFACCKQAQSGTPVVKDSLTTGGKYPAR